MATDLSSINRVKYGGLDFDTIEDELRAELQVQFAASFNDFSVSSLGIVLLDVVSFGLDTLAFYLDRRATDMYLATARTRRSVALLTRQLGYKMGGAVAASTDLQVAAKVAYGFPVPIPKGFQWLGPNNIIFESAQAVTIPASSTVAVKIPVYQGVTVTESFVSDGTVNQKFNLTRVPTDSSIVQGTVQVTVNGSPWTESEFISFDATDQYEINYNEDPPTIRFGDGVAGNIPVKNGSISVTYVGSLGASGQALSHTITKESSPLVVLFTPISLVVDNPDNTVGGSDLEDLSHAKTYAPRVFKSRRVAITRQDYEALAGSFADPLFGRVAVAQAISARSAATDLELQNLLTDINVNIAAAVTSILTALNDPTSGLYALTAVLGTAYAQLQTDLTSLLSKLNNVNANVSSVLSNARTTKSNAQEAQTDYSDAHALVTTVKTTVTAVTTFINSLPVAGDNTTPWIQASDKTAQLTNLQSITDNINRVDSLLALINALASSMAAAADSQVTAGLAISSTLTNDVGLSTSTANSIVNDMQTQLTAAAAAIGLNVAPFTGIYGGLNSVKTSSTMGQTAVAADTVLVQQHVDKFLSADCKANLVVVPILARDASGFYAAPSIGLIKSLQTFLDGVKEVTQSVAVTSGVGFLIPAAIRVRLSVLPGISEQVTQASAVTIVDGVMRDRAFGQCVYVSDLVEPLSAITGVVFVNVTILGYRPTGGPSILADKLDADGNLVVSESEVATLSQSDLTVTTEVFTG